MKRFWDETILPIIEKTKRKHIVEIGYLNGKNTRNLLSYCIENKAKLSSIDPVPTFPFEDYKIICGDYFSFYKDLSLNALTEINNYDMVLIDGDHNWYTVYNELKAIERNKTNKTFPIVILHDVSWPYARRDMYYNPENIPEEYRHPYKKSGMILGQSELVDGAFNFILNNVCFEGGFKNGVLTAVEDFLDETNLNLHFKLIEKWNGLGIIYPYIEKLDKIITPLFHNSSKISCTK